MNELYFFTTNRQKLANLKHIGRLHGFNILSFREKTYFGPYEEPKIKNRQELLRRSYESALEKWKKSFGENDPRIFILEDTSVKIEALSQREEFPGVNVKFWMKKMTFKKLDAKLKSKENNRRVTVRSDLVAHIPKKYQSLLGAGTPYIAVSGEISGYISNTEEQFDQNLACPWLDNKSFNRWFIPDGFDRPISTLSISDADKCDFRNKAFQELVRKFSGLLQPVKQENRARQLTLTGYSNFPIFVIAGYSCAGKSTIADWLSCKYGFLHMEASDYMRRIYWERHGVPCNIPIGDFAEKALSTEPGIVSQPAAKQIENFDYPYIVLTGLRTPEELMELKKSLSTDRLIELIFIEADESVRQCRAKKRAREADITVDTLLKRDRQEERMGLLLLSRLDEAKKLKNNGSSFQTYFNEFDSIFLKALEDSIVPNALSHLGQAIGGLESLILRTLLNADKPVTTTQIAKGIFYYFGEKKSKNNVSRYFNQEFHVYYKVAVAGNKSLYELSATGKSLALLLELLQFIAHPLFQTKPHKVRVAPRVSAALL